MSPNVVADLEGLAALREEWQALLPESLSPTPFQTWEWHYHWWEVFGAGSAMHTLVLRDRGGLVGIVPLMWHRKRWWEGGLRELRFADTGGMVAPYADVIFHRGRAEACAAALLDHLEAERGWDRIVLRGVREDSQALGIVRQEAERRGRPFEVVPQDWGLFVELPASFEEYLAGMRRSTRKHLRRDRGRLSRRYRAELSVCGAQEELERDWQALVEMVRERWRGRGEPTLFDDPAHVEFVGRFLHSLYPTGAVRLLRLTLDGEPAGLDVALLQGEVCYLWYHGYRNPRPQDSVGEVLTVMAIEHCIEARRFRRCDLLAGDFEHKRRLASRRRQIVTLRRYAPSWRSRAYRLAAVVARRRASSGAPPRGGDSGPGCAGSGPGLP